MQEQEFIEYLRKFSRKERYILVQNALGERAKTLDCGFVDRINKELNPSKDTPILGNDAWWTTDFHLDWLFAARRLVYGPASPNNSEGYNNELPERVPEITGNQQDIDMVIASGHHVVLIEAKGDMSWDNGQMVSKFKRMQFLIENKTGRLLLYPGASSEIRFHMVLVSLRKPEKLKCREWPCWAKKMENGTDGKPYWLPLEAKGDLLKVERSKAVTANSPNRDHKFWKVASAGKAGRRRED